MTGSRDTNNSWVARWRGNRRRKRQDDREREYFAAQQAQPRAGLPGGRSARPHSHWDGMAWGSFWGGSGGDWGGGDGGGGC